LTELCKPRNPELSSCREETATGVAGKHHRSTTDTQIFGGVAQYCFSIGPVRAIYRKTLRRPEIDVSAELDAIDWKILKELQDNGRITNVELARRVGISAPPSLRRVRALEEAGYIKGYRALLDEKLLGYELTVFAMVHLTSQAEADLTAFEAFVRGEPLVRECWMLSGEIDFILKCVAPDLRTFQAFVAELTAAPHVRNIKTSLALKNSKDAPMVPLELTRAR
jgi:DNA-binding Lrp family transcriptional regulator